MQSVTSLFLFGPQWPLNRRASSAHNPLHPFCEFCCFWIHICLSKCSSRWYVMLAVYKSFNTGPMHSGPSSISTSHISANPPIWGEKNKNKKQQTRWILLNLKFLHWILMFKFSKGLMCVCVCVFVCMCIPLSIYNTCRHLSTVKTLFIYFQNMFLNHLLVQRLCWWKNRKS